LAMSSVGRLNLNFDNFILWIYFFKKTISFDTKLSYFH